MTLARYYAKQAVKAQWQRQGLKPHHVVASELNRQADAYLDQHPELITLATERYKDFVKRSLAQRQTGPDPLLRKTLEGVGTLERCDYSL